MWMPSIGDIKVSCKLLLYILWLSFDIGYYYIILLGLTYALKQNGILEKNSWYNDAIIRFSIS
jgi:hypothetical protein